MKKILFSLFLIMCLILWAWYLRMKKTTEKIANNQTGANQLLTPTGTSQHYPLNKEKTFIGAASDAVYGVVRVEATIVNRKIVAVQLLQYPNDQSTSTAINQYALPRLVQEAIQAQSAHVDIISGATLTSEAFIRSLQSALNQDRG